MDSQAQAPAAQAQPGHLALQVRTWVEVNKKRLLYAGIGIVTVVAIVLILMQQQAGKEATASKSLSDIRIPFNPAVAPEPGTADKLLRVANEYKGTRAAASALQLCGGVLYTEKDFVRAQERFNAVIQQYPECPWVAHAQLGVGACLEAQGKTDEAIKKFEDIRKRYATSDIIDDAKLALARLYENSNATESFKLYEELVKGNPNSGKTAEAGMRQEDLLKKHPELAKLREPIAPPPSPQPPIQVTPMTNRPPGSNRTINLTNLIPRPVTNAPPAGTPAPATPAAPAAPAPPIQPAPAQPVPPPAPGK